MKKTTAVIRLVQETEPGAIQLIHRNAGNIAPAFQTLMNVKRKRTTVLQMHNARMILGVLRAIVIRVMMEMVTHAQTLTSASSPFAIEMHTVPISKEDMTVPVSVVLPVMVTYAKVTF